MVRGEVAFDKAAKLQLATPPRSRERPRESARHTGRAYRGRRAMRNVEAIFVELTVGGPLGDERHSKLALFEKRRKLPPLRTPKAERDFAVAAASVLARDTFVRALAAMGERWSFAFPKGASRVVEAGKKFVREHGEDALPKVAKVHFATTSQVLAERAKPPPHGR